MSSIVKSTIVVTIFNTIGLFLGFISGLVLAWYLGAGAKMDVYLAATALPMFLGGIIGSVMNITFIPVFVEHKYNRDIWRITSGVLNISIAATTIITFLIIIFAKPIMSALTPGFSIENVTLAASLVRLQIPIIILFAINELMAGIYYSNQKFVTPLLNKVISPIITILFVVLFSKYLSVYSLVYATLLGMFVQTLVLAIGFFNKKDFEYKFIFELKNPVVIKVFKLMLPLITGMLFYRIIPVFDRYIASNLSEGSISHLGYSFKMYSQIPPLISTGVAMTLFPVLSAMAINKDWTGLKQKMSQTIKIILFLSLPIVFIFFLFSLPIIELLFQRGKFTFTDSTNTSLALSFYILALPVATVGDIISKGYYALQDTLTPAIISIAEIIIYISVAYLFLPKFGYLAIPIAYAIYFNSSIINGFIVRRKLGGKGGKTIVRSFIKHFIGCIFIFGIFYFPIKDCENIFAQNLLILLSLILYFALFIWVVKSDEALYIWENIFKRMLKTKPHNNKSQIR